jgi:hypothetical protein
MQYGICKNGLVKRIGQQLQKTSKVLQLNPCVVGQPHLSSFQESFCYMEGKGLIYYLPIFKLFQT